MPRHWLRTRAVLWALFYAFAPWQWYEGGCHYAPASYVQHCALNLALAWRWIRGRQSWGDVRHEVRANESGRRCHSRKVNKRTIAK